MLSLGFFGFLDSPTTAPHGSNGASLGPCWCRSSTWPAKSHTGSHRAEFGFCLLAGASQEDHPPFRQSRIRTQAEEKTPLPCFSKIEPVKFVIPCKRFSKLPGENPFSLFSGADFALPQADPRTYAPRYFRTQTADPAFPWPGPHVSPHSLAGRLAQPCPLHSVRHGLVDGPYRVQEHTVFYFAVSPLDGGLLCVDESLLLQPVHVLPHRVGAHPCALADSLKAGPALIRLPVLAE